MQPTIAFLHLGQTHDEFPDVTSALARLGLGSERIALDDSDRVDWCRYAAVNVRECRGYHLDEHFLTRLEQLHRRIAPVDFVNPMPVVRGALDKSAYLPALEAAGVDLVPTYWPSGGVGCGSAALFDDTGWNDIVVKPAVSSRSWHTFRLTRTADGIHLRGPGPPAPARRLSLAECQTQLNEVFAGRSLCVQRFLPEIQTRGETSFVFLGGALSHAVTKTVAPGGWLAHEFYGGGNAPCAVRAQDAAWAEEVYARLVGRFGRLHYAPIDALPDRDRLLLLECELIVPRLFLREGAAVDRYAAVLASVLRSG